MKKDRTKSNASQRSKDSLTQEVYETLLNRFLNNELVPGNLINRKELADEFNVSMAPIREALLRLSMEGFVETIPRKGTIAKAVNRDDLYGILMFREAIECQAARLYCGTMVEKNRNHLIEYAQKVDESYVNLVEHWQLDITFHQQLICLSKCKTLETEYKRFMKVGTFYHMNSFLTDDDRSERLSHIDLIELLTTHDPDKAEAAIREHLKSGKKHFF